MNFFVRLKASLRLREAIRMADKAHLKTGNRYYVLPQYNSGGKKLVVMDRQNFRRMKLKHYINHDVKVFDLVRECFYCTGYRNGSHYLSPSVRNKKVKQYFDWVERDPK